MIFFNNVGYLGMCGHGTIGLVATLAQLGRLEPGAHRIDTPVGRRRRATLHDDGRVDVDQRAELSHGASGRASTCPASARSRGDVAWGGNWFFLVEDHGRRSTLGNVEALTELRAARVRQAINAQGYPRSRSRRAVRAAVRRGRDSRNFVLCPGRAYDRSPCGTGTSAKLACLAADGKLAEGEPGCRRA